MANSKRLSSGLLEMKFMQRTKNRMEAAEKKKEEDALANAYLGTSKEPKTEAAAVGDDADLSPAEKKPRFIYADRYDVLEGTAFGRMSFGGFNPAVEKLMKYYKDLSEGKTPEEADTVEFDIPDEEMAEKLGGARTSMAKKFAHKKDRNQNHNINGERTLIDEQSSMWVDRGRDQGRRGGVKRKTRDAFQFSKVRSNGVTNPSEAEER